ncbi:MAG: tRNA (adenosine(37)-N6)-threonylcarbamoyltransferase complex transferase subunit TsaD [Saprospirales bacterium]|nr:MAG: tRNA (adenosine(37)-N6)-threonylcarbamoyltransferase complex transferase subunit TsaD [Saprospirales bacterium]
MILAIESSCDDTSCAISVNGVVRANIVANQTVHKNYGGVVPELASRAHLSHIIPVVDAAIKEAGIKISDLNAIAFTQGPGLLGSLIVGNQFAKGLAVALDLPLIAINHMEAHILAHFIDAPIPSFPFLNLTVSGGHTELVIMHDYFQQDLIGQTLDDAAGEAFDKCGKMLGLPYPSGPEIDKLAKAGEIKFNFPTARVGEFEFSFSGLKTSVMYFLKRNLEKDPDFIHKEINNIAASVQDAIVKTLVNKTLKAAKRHQLKQIAVSGGVSVNSELRNQMINACGDIGAELFLAAPKYCTDNAAMIAMAAHFKYLKSDFCSLKTSAEPRLSRQF